MNEGIKDYEEVFDQIIEVPFTNNSTTKRYFDGSGVAKHLQFKNDLRTQSYELTPYDETLLLDSDYIIANSLFKHCFEQDHDFLIFKNAIDLTAWRNTDEFQKISDASVDFYWATVIFFRKSVVILFFFGIFNPERSKSSFFDLPLHPEINKIPVMAKIICLKSNLYIKKSSFRNIVNITDDMNSTVINGTPLQNSI